MALLVSAIIATAVMSVALTAKMNGGQNGKTDRHEIAGEAVKNISSALRNFASGCCDVQKGCNPNGYGAGNLWTCYPISGPNVNDPSYHGWTFNNYPLATGPVGDSGFAGRYALLNGTHILTNVLPSWFTAAPYNAQVSYTVNAAAGVPYTLPAAFPATPVMPPVYVSVTWTEPVSP